METKKYKIRFTDKKHKTVKKITIESENDIGIVLKAKMMALREGFRYNKRKHDVSFREI